MTSEPILPICDEINGEAVVLGLRAHEYIGERRDRYIALKRNDPLFPKTFRPSGRSGGPMYFRKRELDSWLHPNTAASHIEAANAERARLTSMLLTRIDTKSFDLTDRAKATSGVYFLYLGDDLLYIGQSVNVYARVRNHRHMGYDRVMFLPCPKADLDLIESLAIVLLAPKRNGPPPLRQFGLLSIMEQDHAP